MASYIDMSLEDIIKKKKTENVKTKPVMAPNSRSKRNLPHRNLEITDARNKIISKKRTQITDAREKLAELAKQKDARLKIEQKKLKRALTQSQGRNYPQYHGKFTRIIPNKERVFVDPSRQVVSQPLNHIRRPARRHMPHKQNVDVRKFMESRSIGKMLKPILRTVENDVVVIDDPMGEEYVPPSNASILNRKANLQLKIIAHNNDSYDRRSSVTQRTMMADKERSPPRPPSILKKRPMAALRIDKPPEKPVLEYRIIVSNLRNTVTGGDIEELFGDVGGMVESRLVRPGTAEVIYKSQEDAQKAVDLYHNRQLDGQPMNCLLVTPRPNMPHAALSTKSSGKPALVSTNSNVEPDISTFHKVLFSNF